MDLVILDGAFHPCLVGGAAEDVLDIYRLAVRSIDNIHLTTLGVDLTIIAKTTATTNVGHQCAVGSVVDGCGIFRFVPDHGIGLVSVIKDGCESCCSVTQKASAGVVHRDIAVIADGESHLGHRWVDSE